MKNRTQAPADRTTLVTVGRVARPHGVRGELRVVPDTDFPQRLLTLREAVLLKEEQATAVQIEAVRPHGSDFLVKIDGIKSVEQAQAWRGALVAVPRADTVPLPPGRYYVFDVLGLRVETESGRVLGTVSRILRTGGNDVYVVRGASGEVLIPAVSSVVVSIDVAAGKMVIRPMEGLLE